ncbi:hypothetical protein SLEP1_g8551 [Rubroshorea leprosula]|uniref:Alginate lyase 2 domain-containing protein n=1 Tax=Rubroshorea leprosula TaxID=152421 RepID=A0AAV5ICZ5_9ROSI|nr:hypothetical protein SLEP1_g8551 [Rubroshorea leprosula]
MASFIFLLLFCLSLIAQFSPYQTAASGAIDPTKGFLSLPLNQSNFVIQKPYDIPVDQRYKFSEGVHKLWVYSNDKPHSPDSQTKPRTEIRIHGYDYSTGVWQFEGYGYVPYGTSGVCIMQVFGLGPDKGAPTVMLKVYNGSLSFYRNQAQLVPYIYDRWFRLNVIHDVDASKVQVFIDGVLKYDKPTSVAGVSQYYFKCGVYAQEDDSDYMESRWKDIKILKK